MDAERFDKLAKAVGNRRALVVALLGGVLPAGAHAKPKCRDVGHPCEGNQTCCAGLECRVTGPGNAERCAVPGQPDPDPVDPPDDGGNGGNGGGGSGGGDRKRRRRRKRQQRDSVAAGNRCRRNRECKSGKCQRRRCCDPVGNHCTADNQCCSGNCMWVHDPTRPNNSDPDRQCAAAGQS